MATFIRTSRITPTVAPRLPSSPEPPDRIYIEQLSNVLRLYFNQIDSAIGPLVNPSGGAYLNFPYGAFSSFVSQSATANTATKMLFATTDFANAITAPSSQITVVNPGIYNLQFSVQVQNLQTTQQDMFIWLKKNGTTDIPGSTGVIGLPAQKSVGVPSRDIKGWNYLVSLDADEYIEIYWSVADALVTIPTYAASGTPTKPSTASVVATMSFVSTLPA
jgi:hypothetical protein